MLCAEHPSDEFALRLDYLGDWRAFRHRLLSAEAASDSSRATKSHATQPMDDKDVWAHMLATSERGCLLVAQPNVLFNGRSPLNQGVVLVLQDDEEGTLGLSLNVETETTFGTLLESSDELPGLGLAFGSRPLNLGGASDELDGPRSVYMLTDESAVMEHDAEEVIPGLYNAVAGGAAAAHGEGRLCPSSCHFFAGHWFWPVGKLEKELEHDAWYCGAASASAVKQLLDSPANDVYLAALRMLGGEAAKAAEH